MPLFDTALVYLRPIQLFDVPAWYAYLSIPSVIEHTSWNLNSESDLEKLAMSYLANEAESPIRFAIVDKASDKLVGTVGFHSLSSASQSAELAYDIHPSFWGNGIATEVCKWIVGWGHSACGFSRIQACVLDTNVASKRVLEKCGFSQEDKLRSLRMVRGVPRDFFLYSISSTPRMQSDNSTHRTSIQ